MTKKEMFAHIATINADHEDIVEFCNKEIEHLEKRSSSKTPTKAQKENEGLIKIIAEALPFFEEGATVSDLIASVAGLEGLSNQKVSALLRKMVESKSARKEMKGKKALFYIA